MNFAGIEMTGRLPYRDVYIHPTVLDERGAVMSKSKGNGVDPLAVIDGATLAELQRPVEEARPTNMKELLRRVERNFPDGFEGVGADALRFTLVRLCSEGQEMRLSLSKFHEIGRRFLTKLWNASRFALIALDEIEDEGPMGEPQAEDRWIVSRANACASEVRRALDSFDFAAVGAVLYRFVWNDFCDWYVELAKVRLRSGPEAARRTAATLGRVLSDTLHLLHPVTPFVTEHLFARLRLAMDRKGLWNGGRPGADLLTRSAFPEGTGRRDPELEERFAALQRLVSGVRKLRADAGLPPDLRLLVRVEESPRLPGFGALLAECREPVCSLARLTSVSVASPGGTPLPPGPEPGAGRVSIVDPAFEAHTTLGEAVDLEALRQRVERQLGRLGKERESTRKRLSNPGFLAGADRAVVDQARQKLASLEDQTERLRELAGQLGGGR